MNTTDVYAKLNSYGVSYEGEQGAYVPTEEFVTLSELAARGGRIVRVRWIGGDYVPGRGKCYDLSYVHGEVVEACGVCDGRGQNRAGGGDNFQTSTCRNCYGEGEVSKRVSLVSLPAAFLIPRRGIMGALIDWAKSEGVFAKGLGLLDDGNFSILG